MLQAGRIVLGRRSGGFMPLIDTWLKSAEQHGVARAKIRTVLSCVSRKKRTGDVVADINDYLNGYGLFVLNLYVLNKSKDLDSYVLMSKVNLHMDQMTSSLSEDRLSRTIIKNQSWAKMQLGLDEGDEWSDIIAGNPIFWKGTRGRLDLHTFRKDERGMYKEFVAIELKSAEASGGFEQLTGYLYYLKKMQEMENCLVRGVLISGLEDVAPHLSFSILSNAGVRVEWFLYKCEDELVYLDRLTPFLSVEEVA
jgi:hypothetical protein